MKRGEAQKLGWATWAVGLLEGLVFLVLNPFGLAFILAVGFVCLFFAHLQ